MTLDPEHGHGYPGAALAPEGGVPAKDEPAAAPSPSSRYLRTIIGAGVAAGLVALVVAERATIDAGGDSLAYADLEWLAVALVLTTALWVAGTAAQLGSMPIRPPLSQLFAVQVAASFVNHVVPGGVGGMAVNVRYLQRSGMTRPAAVAAVGLNSIATLITHLVLIGAVWLSAPVVLPGGALHRSLDARIERWAASAPMSGLLLRAGIVTLAVALAAVVLLRVRGRGSWSPARRMRAAAVRLSVHLRRELHGLALVLRRPGRAVLLWVGSAASPALHAFVLVAVYRSLTEGVGVGTVTLMLVYLVASSVSALVPSPGGFGALDVTLVAGLVTVGAPTTTAIAVVLGYRLVTVWVPLVPGAIVFAVLLRRRLV